MKIRFGEFVLDSDTGSVTSPHGPVELRRQTFRLLVVLLNHAPNLIDRDTLLDQAWGHDALSQNILAQAISELRQALGDRARAPRYIATVHRRGYRVVCPVERIDPESPRPTGIPEPDPSANPEYPDPANRGKRLTWAILASGLLGIAALWWVADPVLNDFRQGAEPATPTFAFNHLPASEEIPEWLPAGMLEVMARQLSADGRVVALRSDALGPASELSEEDWLQMTAELFGADLALTGRWQTDENDDLVLVLNLIDPGTGRRHWQQVVSGTPQSPNALVARALDELQVALGLGTKPVAIGWRTLQADRQLEYLHALGMKGLGHSDQAATIMSRLYHEADRPGWMAPELAQVLAQSGRRAAAVEILMQMLERPGLTPNLADTLRSRAELARLQHAPDDLIATLRALITLFPHDIDLLFELIVAELDNTSGEGTGSLLVHLEQALPHGTDPRLQLLRARLARLEGNLQVSEDLARSVADAASRYRLPLLEIAARSALAQTFQARGDRLRANEIMAQAAPVSTGSDRVEHNPLVLNPAHSQTLRRLSALTSPSGSQRLHESAVEANRLALPIYRELELDSQAARSAFVQAVHARNQGRFNDAEKLFAEARELYLAIGRHDRALRTSTRRADLLITVHRLEEAEAEIESSREWLSLAQPLQRSDWLTSLGQLHMARGDLASARTALEAGRQLRIESEQPDWAAYSELLLLTTEKLQDLPPATVRARATELRDTFSTLNEPRLLARTLALIAETYLIQRNPDDARLVLAEARLALARAPVVLIELELDWLSAWTLEPDMRLEGLRLIAERGEELGMVNRIRQAIVLLDNGTPTAQMAQEEPVPLPSYAVVGGHN